MLCYYFTRLPFVYFVYFRIQFQVSYWRCVTRGGDFSDSTARATKCQKIEINRQINKLRNLEIIKYSVFEFFNVYFHHLLAGMFIKWNIVDENTLLKQDTVANLSIIHNCKKLWTLVSREYYILVLTRMHVKIRTGCPTSDYSTISDAILHYFVENKSWIQMETSGGRLKLTINLILE